MEGRPMVTVVMPLYNAERYVADAIASVAAQAGVDTELIVADDGSTDRSVEVAEAAAEKSGGSVRLLKLEHGGVSKARNAALAEARGKYVMFLDADDMLMPDAIKRLTEVAEQQETDGRPLIVAGQTIQGREMEEAMRKNAVRKYGPRRVEPEKAIELSLYRKTPGLDSSMSSKLFSRELFDELRFRENTRFEDLDLYYRVYQRATGGITLTDEAVTFYRTHEASFTHTWSPGQIDSLAVTRRMMQRLRNNARLTRAASDRRVSAAFRLMVVMMKTGEKNERAMKACRLIVKRHGMATVANRQARLRNRVAALLVNLLPIKR